MAEQDYNFRHRADRARVQQYTHNQYLGWQECDGGLKKDEPATLIPSQFYSAGSASW
jgi:hypothetical protein